MIRVQSPREKESMVPVVVPVAVSVVLMARDEAL